MIRWAVPFAFLAAGCDRENCGNGADDDGDGFADCADQDCASECTEDCDNTTDDDADGLVDCDDPACRDVCPTTPAGPENCTNGIDDDLDAWSDCQDDDCRTTCDADADGYEAPEVGGTDCNDDDSDVHPGADEVPYNGGDDDCDAATPDDDLDGDGFLLAEDCDDSSSVTFPGAPETCGNGLVDDCDASVVPDRSVCFTERSLSTADTTFLSGTANTFVGASVTVVGDADGDGDDDYVVGATGDGSSGNGSAMLVPSAVGVSNLTDTPVKWIAPSEHDAAGTSLSFARGLIAGGVNTVLVGAPYTDDTGLDSGAAYVVQATFDPADPPEIVDLAPPLPRLVGEAEGDAAGFAVAGAGDADQDGFDDAVVGAPSAAGGLGVAYVAYGQIVNTVSLSTATERIRGDAVGDEAGCAVAFAGDPSGDGATDVLVGACGAATGAGRVALITVHDGIERPVSGADAVWTGSPGDQLGAAVAGAGDIDGDGTDDLLLGAPGAGGGAGSTRLVRGPAAGPDPVAEAELLGANAGDAAGTAVRGLGDVDGDGLDDLAVGAPLTDGTGTDAGTAYVLFGPVSGVVELDSAPVRLTGMAAFDHAGASIDGRFDADGDGYSDVLVGAPFHDGLAPSGGAMYLLTFGL